MNLSDRDQEVIWHPYTQMKTAGPPMAVTHAKGEKLFLEDGRTIIDAVSSWWVTVHGHSHPYIAEAIANQATKLEQVIFSGFTHQPAVELAEKLLEILPANMSRIFYSDNGSTAVEVGIKMAYQYFWNQGKPRKRIIALKNAYHGDTFGAMSASGRSVFTAPYEDQLFEVSFLSSPADCDKELLQNELESLVSSGDVAAVILEPLVQGAGGMKMYSVEALETIISICRKNNILVIFDEVMTGFFRTGKMFAMDHLQLKPDIVCLSKGLTGGFLPLSVTACTNEVYSAFLDESRHKMLFHGHSFTANPLGCAAALASLDLFGDTAYQQKIEALCAAQKNAKNKFEKCDKVENVRSTGTILAMDLRSEDRTGYMNDAGGRIVAKMLENGVLIRPLGNVLYIMPPYCIEITTLEKVHELLWMCVNE